MRVITCIILTSVIVLCSSCRTQYIPVESIVTRTEYKDRVQRDSVHVHDSIYIREKDDTVFIDRWHTEYKDRLLRDTAYISRTDSIQIPCPVERNLSWWESFKLQVGEIAIGVITSLLLIVAWMIRRNK